MDIHLSKIIIIKSGYGFYKIPSAGRGNIMNSSKPLRFKPDRIKYKIYSILGPDFPKFLVAIPPWLN